MPTKPVPHSKRALWRQAGGFSPFMFGMLMGMTIFSALSLQWAQQALIVRQQKQLEDAKAAAEETAKGMAFAVLSETANDYSSDYTLNRARAFAATTAQTRSGEDAQIVQREEEEESDNTRFGKTRTVVGVNVTDDPFLRQKVAQTRSAEELQRVEQAPLATVEITNLRGKQVKIGRQRMADLAEQLYSHYAGHLSFPNASAFDALEKRYNLRDPWGRPFVYEPAEDLQTATLTFTTPWNFTQTLHLSLKDDTE
jgi:hypothetical protein